jgi:hypothetical protein
MSITSGLMELICLCGIINEGDEMECAIQRYICRALHLVAKSSVSC